MKSIQEGNSSFAQLHIPHPQSSPLPLPLPLPHQVPENSINAANSNLFKYENNAYFTQYKIEIK